MNTLRYFCAKSSCLSHNTILTRVISVSFLKNFCTENWKYPNGYDTGISCYNSMARREVPLILKNQNLVTWYMCGPTVYDDMHIGHAYSYIHFDVIRRLLEKYFHKDVVLVMGITDVDDKIIARSREMNVSIKHMVKNYEQEFFADLGKLQILPPTVITRVTDHIPQIIEFCKEIHKKELAYVTPEGTLYFDTNKFGKFGKLSNMGLAEVNNSIDLSKRDARDFALWKAAKPGEPWWETPWGKGRPGWHIECSAMASHILGSQLDMHSGGKDLIFPHHENEETQSEVFHDTHQWANYWLHTGHLHLQNDVKMAKSLQNTISVKSIMKKASPNDFRILCLRMHYRNDLEYSDEILDECKSINKKLKEFVIDAEAYIEGKSKCGPIDEVHLMKCLNETRDTVHHCFSNDFNTANALNNIIQFVGEVNKNLQISERNLLTSRSPGVIAACSTFVNRILNILGIQYTSKMMLNTSNEEMGIMLSNIVDSFVKFRTKVRLYALTTGSASQPQYKISSKSSEEKVDETSAMKESLPTPPAQPPHDKGDLLWTEKTLETSEKKKLHRKEREPLIQACDDVRDELFIAGIQLKDRGKESTWSILENRTLEGKKSSLSSCDTFDPNYIPKK